MTAIEILCNEHQLIVEALNLLERHLRELDAGRPFNPEFARWMIEFLREFADDTHHAKEEGVLFGLLEQRGLTPSTGPLAAMLADHARCRTLAEDMDRALLRGDAVEFAARGRQLAELLRRHVARENETLFGMAAGLLTPDEDAKAVQAFGRVVREREGVLVRQRHLAAMERWRKVLVAA